jgi:cysteine synthase
MASVLDLIGETPLLELTQFDRGPCQLFLKLESANPSGSIKDRPARAMIDAAEADGRVRPGGIIVEATAGNTGLGLALVGGRKDYHILLVVPDKMAREKILHCKAMGAEVADTPHPWYDVSGGVYPAYQVMRALYAASGAPYRASETSAPRDVQPLAFETPDGLELWLANLLSEPRVVDVEGIELTGARHAILDASTFEVCARGSEGFEGAETIHRGGPLTLEPFAAVRLRLSL